MKKFKITINRNGRMRVYRFDTLESAQQVANEIARKTGVIVGIELTHTFQKAVAVDPMARNDYYD